MSKQDTVVNDKIITRAPIASACFAGLGQILFLKQYLRGALYALAEFLMIFFVVFDVKNLAFNFKGPIVNSLVGLITLGDAKPHLPIKERDHSIFMMITGLIVLIIVLLYICVYVFNIYDAKKSAKQIVEKNKYPTFAETKKMIHERAFPYIGLTPVVILMAFFTIVPLLFSALVAFTNYSSPDHIPPNNLVDWVGLENFRTMFSSRAAGSTGMNPWFVSFVRAAIWTVVWAFLSTITCYMIGMLFAVILVDKRIKFSKVFRTIFILPYAIPTMLSLFIWNNLLNGTFGPINRTLIALGLIEHGIPWLSDPNMAKVTLILVNIWIGFPYSMILITSNMTAIPGQLYEAATIDGANKFQQYKSITFPLVLYQTMPILIMQFASNINNFGAVFFLTGGGPPYQGLTVTTNAGATDLLISWIYKLTMNTPNMYNLASVLSILVFIVLVPFALYNFTRTKSFKEGEF
ncbi:sugar ABC transporter permease [Brucepastera parasyntrophica]|uniref:carbohydrate ABC transporter permease n=1 Tax=Brucepastera parasyntrophica TaxID=2880008 RepID=UPI00210EFE3D|nr:sugar ABC transporter permease [Brucepastera parasyntrophica]ULQ60949.1 sugar ABC transporter permease [Brucepastera parasyntrophica]